MDFFYGSLTGLFTGVVMTIGFVMVLGHQVAKEHPEIYEAITKE
jgi:hypothetical protein